MTYFDIHDDPLSNAGAAMIKRLLRSPIFCLICVATFGGLTTILAWNFAVDCYVIAKGQSTTVQITQEDRSYVGRGKNLTTASYKFFAADQPDTCRLFPEILRGGGRPGEGEATLAFSKRTCQGNGQLTLCYLVDSPGVYVVKEDYASFFLQPLFIGLSMFAAGGTGWSFIRVSGQSQPDDSQPALS